MKNLSNIQKAWKLFQLSDMRASVFLIPVAFSILATLFEAIHIALLIPLVHGILQMGFQNVQDSFLLRWLIEWFPGLLHSNKAVFISLVLIVFFSAIAKQVFDFASKLTMSHISRTFIHDLRKVIFSNYLKCGKLFFDRNSAGSLQHILMNFTQVIGDQLYYLQHLLAQFFMFIAYFVIVFSISWKLTLLSMTMLPLMNVLIKWVIKKIEKTSLDYAESQKDIGRTIFNTLSCIQVVKSYCTEQKEREIFSRTSDGIRRLEYSLDKKRFFIPPTQEMVMLSGILMLVTVMTFMAVQGGGSAAIARFLIFFYALRRAIYAVRVWNEGKGLLAGFLGPIVSILDLLETCDQHVIPDGKKELVEFKQSIQLDRLNYSFIKETPVLEDLSAVFEKGKITALVGPTGSGKTTIINLIMRYYDCPPASIKIDGVDIREYSIRSLREKIAIVSQDIQLFNDTIRFNVTYGFERLISDEEVWMALKKARLEPFVKRQPKQLDTIVGDRGVQLSGGERQRLSIARAFLKGAEILILDEATSSLDSETEKSIQEAIEELMLGKTSIVIAHRFSTIKHADKIIFIQNGKVLEEGSFSEMMDYKGRFYEFWKQQKIA